MARLLTVRERTLRHRLAAEGLSFSELLDEERCRRTKLELGRSDSSITRSAASAGFRERTSFHRAFKRWTGQTPLHYMKRKRDAP